MVSSIQILRNDLIGYSDSTWRGDQDDQRSITRHILMFSAVAISWSFKKWLVVAFSTCETEYVVATLCARNKIS